MHPCVGRPRVDDRRVLISIISINFNGLRWCDAPAAYGPPKTLYDRWKRWCDLGVFAAIMDGLAVEDPNNKTISIDTTYLKAHRTASHLWVQVSQESCAIRQAPLQTPQPYRTDVRQG